MRYGKDGSFPNAWISCYALSISFHSLIMEQEYCSSMRNNADIFYSMTFAFYCTILKASRGNPASKLQED